MNVLNLDPIVCADERITTCNCRIRRRGGLCDWCKEIRDHREMVHSLLPEDRAWLVEHGCGVVRA